MSVLHRTFCMPTLCMAVAMVAGWVAVSTADSVNAAESRVTLHSYVKADTKLPPEKAHYFALGLVPGVTAPERQACDVVVLFDTSASQIGQYRKDALAALAKLATGLATDDRLFLMALDIDAKPMGKNFTTAGSSDWKASVSELERRIPLGATDMVAGLSAAAGAFTDTKVTGGKTSPQRAVVYIGDGVASVNLSSSQDFVAALRKLVSLRAPVSSYAIGPDRDDLLLAAVSNQTGGSLMLAGTNVTAEQAGSYLAAAVQGVVLWTDLLVTPQSAQVYPQPMIPVRLDRDTVVVGSGRLDAGAEIRLRGTLAGKPVELSWKVPADAPQLDNAYLEMLVESARRDNGASLATLSSRGLDLARMLAFRNSEFLAQNARQAIAAGNLKNGRTLVDQLKRVDPNHPHAALLEKALEPAAVTPKNSVPKSVSTPKKSSAYRPSFYHPASPFRLVGNQVDDAPPRRTADADDVLAGTAVADRRRHEARVIKEIEVMVNDARRQVATSPRNVLDELKSREVMVDRDPILSPEVRSQLQDKLTSAIKEAQRHVETQDIVFANRVESEAAKRERERIVAGLLSDQERMRQLMAQFRALMNEGYYAKAEMDVAPEVAKYEPDDPDRLTSTSATQGARRIGAYRQSETIRDQMSKQMTQTLLSIDESGITFDDRDPIRYPDAKFWEELTARRKEFASVDLKKRGGAEEKIYKALSEPTDLDIIEGETDLKGLQTLIQQRHGIQVELDVAKLTEAGVMERKFERGALRGISLRSALNLLLRPLETGFVIKNEVLMITTLEEVKTTLTTKVYPVADLVLPIKEINFSGFGALGGMGGGQMFNGGGGGGDPGGGGGLGGGGGAF